MLREEPLDWNNDKDCVRVAEFVMDWVTADLTTLDPATAADEFKGISLYAFLMDILVCVGDDRYSAKAQDILAQMGQ